MLAATLSAGVPFTTTTGGTDDAPDVVGGRALAEACDARHELIPDDPHGTLPTDWRRAAELLALTAPGTASLSDAAGFPFGPRAGPLPLWQSGQGGEVARAYYGDAASADDLYRAFVGRRPGRREILSASGAELVQAEIAAFAKGLPRRRPR